MSINTFLTQSARDYSQLLIANNTFGHDFNNTTPQTRAQAAGYDLSVPLAGVGENQVTDSSPTGPFAVTDTEVLYHHDGLVEEPLHRSNMFRPEYREAGIGFGTGSNYTGFGGAPRLSL